MRSCIMGSHGKLFFDVFLDVFCTFATESQRLFDI